MNTAQTDIHTIPCDIVLLPAPAFSAFALEASQTLALQGSMFTLDNQNFYAHASLYMFQMRVSDQGTCITALKEIASQTPEQHLPQNGYHYLDSGFGIGYTDIDYERNSAVEMLQMSVIETLNPLRAGMRESDKEKMKDATGLKLENLQKYGFPSVGEMFRPHLTLTRFPAEIKPDFDKLSQLSDGYGAFNRIGLFEMGENGTCIRKIAEFPLQ